jgi:hypothetical protein
VRVSRHPNEYSFTAVALLSILNLDFDVCHSSGKDITKSSHSQIFHARDARWREQVKG